MTTASDGPSDYLVLGRAPRPTTSVDLDRLLVNFLRGVAAQTPSSVSGLDSVRVESALAGADVSRLSLDLTGLRIGISDAEGEPATADTFGSLVSLETAELREFRLRAQPLVVQGVDFELDGSVEAVKFVWAVDDRGQLGVGESGEDSGPLRIELHAETDQDALVAAATALLDTQLADAGVKVSDVTLELASITPREATIQASARVRKGILGASATFEASANIDDDMVLRITEPRLSSRNPVVAALLLTVRDRITEAVAEPIDLRAALPGTLRLRDVSIDLGDRIRIDLSFG